MQVERVHGSQLFSLATMLGGGVCVSGRVSSTKEGGVQDQTENVLNQIDEALVKAGSDPTKILMAFVILSDMSNYYRHERSLAAMVPGGTPAGPGHLGRGPGGTGVSRRGGGYRRALVRISLVLPGWLIAGQAFVFEFLALLMVLSPARTW